MAYAALLSLAQLLEQILHHDPFFYIRLSDDEEHKLESLHEKASFLQAFMDNCSDKGGERIQFLEAQIRDAAYQAQDIIEFYLSDHKSRSDFKICGATIRKEGSSRIQEKFEQDLMKSMEQIDSIVKEVMNIQARCRSVEGMQVSDAPSLGSSSLAWKGGNKTVGLDEDLIEIKGRLCGESSKLEIIPIVGMGGIGKTTLARNIFDDSLVVYHFDVRAWITVSQEYDLHEILLRLVDYLPVAPMDSKTNEEMIECAYKSLKGRRYLIIMDDMWSVEVWDDLKRIFPDDNNGSRIVITSRLTHLAEYASCSSIHRMHFLNEDQSWNLLREELVFEQQSCPRELEEIGKNIAKSCGGLPLAIAVVAGILAKVDRTQYHWNRIATNISLAMETSDEDFSRVLTLSYDHLPSHLKACFLYMGRFPEDYIIPVSKLIMLWVAEGFLKPIGSKSLEEVAEDYLEDLVKRNLILIVKKKSNGKFRFCGMHDMLRDLCIQKAKEEKFHDVYTSGRDVAKRRLIIRSHVYIEPVSKNTCASSPIRSVLYFGKQWGLFSFVLRLRLLRVLDLPKIGLDYFPIEITKLFHLRYLAVSYFYYITEQIVLPPAISKLHNLQTLIIHGSPYSPPYISFPFVSFQIWKFPKLRHLILHNGPFNIYLSARNWRHFPALENLQTLCGDVNFMLTDKAINMIPNLKRLKIPFTSWSEAKSSKQSLNSLVRLHHLENLSLSFQQHHRGGRHSFPASHALPPNLNKLNLTGCKFSSEEMTAIGSLPNLQVLKLKDFEFVDGN